MLLTASLLLCVLPAQDPTREAEEPESIWQYLAQKYDKDRDGRITPAEYGPDEERFARLDRDGDGAITEADAGSGGRPRARPAQPRGSGERGERPKDGAPKVAAVAPDFELPVLHAEKPASVKLSSFRGEKPVALIFGSYT